MSIYSKTVLEVINDAEGFKAYRSTSDEDWKCLGIMDSEQINWSAQVLERSVVFDRNLRKKSKTDAKPSITFETDDYSWRTQKEVIIEEGDFIFLGCLWDSDNRARRMSFPSQEYCYGESVEIKRVTGFTQKDSGTEAIVKFERVKTWTSEDSPLEEFLATLDPAYRKGVEKALKFKYRDRYWFETKKATKKYDFYDGL